MIDPRDDKEDFADLCRVAAGAMGSSNPALLAILEKDYWVTRVLCAIAADHEEDVVFKGGTSLSKGWGLTQRFSEDIDIAVNPAGRGEAARDTLLKSIARVVVDQCSLPPTVRESSKGVHRSVTYAFEAVWAGGELVHPSVLLEMGVRSALNPVATRRLQTMLADAVPSAEADLPACELAVLRPERTLVEKLFILHAAGTRYLDGQDTSELRDIGRHYYDVARLLSDARVRESLGTDDFWQMVSDHDQRGSRDFPRRHLGPPGLDFVGSAGLFPDDATSVAVAREYEREQDLFFGVVPSFAEVLDALASIRERLSPPQNKVPSDHLS